MRYNLLDSAGRSVHRYCQRLFGVGRQRSASDEDGEESGHNLIPKSIHGRCGRSKEDKGTETTFRDVL